MAASATKMRAQLLAQELASNSRLLREVQVEVSRIVEEQRRELAHLLAFATTGTTVPATDEFITIVRRPPVVRRRSKRGENLELVLQAVQANPNANRAVLAAATGLDPSQVTPALAALKARGQIRQQGQRRNATYCVP